MSKEKILTEKNICNSIFFCFLIDENICDKQGIFEIDNAIMNFECFNENNNTILRVFLKSGSLNYLLGKVYGNVFTITYKIDNRIIYKSTKFEIKKNTNQFIFNSIKTEDNNKYFKNPTCLEQYLAFLKISNSNSDLFSDTLKYLNEYLDIELYLYLLQNNKHNNDDLEKIIEKFPSIKVVYDKNKRLPIENIGSLPIGIGIKKKLLLICSIIQDQTDLIKEFHKEDIDIINEYNENTKDIKFIIPIKKNIFNYFIKNLNQDERDYIIKVCKNCKSIASLVDYLKSDDSKIIKDLTSNDMPKIFCYNNNFKELIEGFVKIKDLFKENEIYNIWKKYLDKYCFRKSIEELEDIKKSFLINEQFYEKIIEYISIEIVKKGKILILNSKLKGFNMYEFINKYISIGEFYSDEYLLDNITRNIDLQELNIEQNYNEFKKCNFFQKIPDIYTKNYISGILKKINSLEYFNLFFKYIYTLKGKEKEPDNKDLTTAKLSISHFIDLLNKKRTNIESIKSLIKYIFLLSLMYFPENNKNNYINLTKQLENNYLCSDLINFFIEEIINADIEKYISNDRKDIISEKIINQFLIKLNIEEIIFYSLKIKSLDFKEKNIYNTFPKVLFEDLLNKDDKKNVFEYLWIFIKKNVLNNNDIKNSKYFNELSYNNRMQFNHRKIGKERNYLFRC